MRKGFWGLIAAILLWGTTEPKAATAPLQAVPTIPNLVAHWGFEESSGSTANDDSGFAHHGAYGATTHAPTSVTTPSPFPGSTRSLQFNQAARSWVEVPDANDLDLTGSFTAAAWVNVTDATEQHGLIEKLGGGPPTQGWSLRLSGTEQLRLTVVKPDGTPQSSVSGNPIATGSWVHVAGIFDSVNQTVRVYGGALPIGPSMPAEACAASPALLILGCDNNNGVNGLNGLMDEVRVYNKVLTEGELSILMQGQAPVTGLVTTPGPGNVQVDWTAPAAVPGVTVTYAVLSGPTATGPWGIEAQGIAGVSHTVSGLPTTPIFFQVIAVSVVASNPTTSGSVTPLSAVPPPPRTNDHEEGLLDGKCQCGTVQGAGSTALWAGLVLALGAILAARRR